MGGRLLVPEGLGVNGAGSRLGSRAFAFSSALGASHESLRLDLAFCGAGALAGAGGRACFIAMICGILVRTWIFVNLLKFVGDREGGGGGKGGGEGCALGAGGAAVLQRSSAQTAQPIRGAGPSARSVLFANLTRAAAAATEALGAASAASSPLITPKSRSSETLREAVMGRTRWRRTASRRPWRVP